jgi:hypothetical protein
MGDSKRPLQANHNRADHSYSRLEAIILLGSGYRPSAWRRSGNKTIFLTPAKWLHKKTNFKLITEPAFLPNTCYVLGGL